MKTKHSIQSIAASLSKAGIPYSFDRGEIRINASDGFETFLKAIRQAIEKKSDFDMRRVLIGGRVRRDFLMTHVSINAIRYMDVPYQEADKYAAVVIDKLGDEEIESKQDFTKKLEAILIKNKNLLPSV